jgi:hypothetical protein
MENTQTMKNRTVQRRLYPIRVIAVGAPLLMLDLQGKIAS